MAGHDGSHELTHPPKQPPPIGRGGDGGALMTGRAGPLQQLSKQLGAHA